MKRVEGTSGIRLIECVSPARNRWRIRWDVQEREDGSASYMEEGFIGKPGPDTIKSVITGWYNDQTDREILSGFVYEDMPVWLSSENQFNYKAAYDLAVQTGGATLPVTFKFGTDEVPQYREFVTLEELTDGGRKTLLIRKITGWNEPFGGGKKKAPGLLNSNANHFFNTRRENSRDRGQIPSVTSSLFLCV